MACTKAALCSGGMQKRLTRHGLSSFFFQPSMDGGVADALDDPEFDQLIAEQVQGPTAAPFGRGAAGQLDQARLGGAIELRQTGWVFLRFALERSGYSLHHAALSHPLDRGTADLQLLHDLLVGQALVRSEQDLGALDHEGSRLAPRAELLESGTLFWRQIHDVAFHDSAAEHEVPRMERLLPPLSAG
jgi:hypothetical protein